MRTNQKWFELETSAATHTIDKIPVTAQIFAFEKALEMIFVLRVDCDAAMMRAKTLSKETLLFE